MPHIVGVRSNAEAEEEPLVDISTGLSERNQHHNDGSLDRPYQVTQRFRVKEHRWAEPQGGVLDITRLTRVITNHLIPPSNPQLVSTLSIHMYMRRDGGGANAKGTENIQVELRSSMGPTHMGR